MILVVYHFAEGDTMQERGEIRWLKWAGPVETLSSFPVIVFAYTCHQNVSFRYKFMREPGLTCALEDVFYS